MKNNLLFLGLILLFNQAIAQNYQAVPHNQINYYINTTSDSQIEGLRIDSTIQTETRFIFPKKWDARNYDCANPFAAMWMGHEMQYRNGKWIFINKSNEEVCLNPYAKIGKIDTAWQGLKRQYLTSKVLKRTFESVLNEQDSLVYIQMNFYDSTGKEQSEKYNKDTLIMGKNTGLVATWAFDTITQHPQFYKLLDKRNATNTSKYYEPWRTVAEFNIGDIFQYEDKYYGPDIDPGWIALEENKVLTKQYYLTQDSVVYTFLRKKQFAYINQEYETTYKITIDTTSESYKLSKWAGILPNEAFFTGQYFYSMKQTKDGLLLDASYNLHLIKESDSCWSQSAFTPAPTVTYLEGSGLFISDGNYDFTADKKELLYFKKGEREWGKKHFFLSLQQAEKINYNLYPTVLKQGENITIDADLNKVDRVQIQNIQGQVLSDFNYNGTTQKLSTNQLAKGIYMIVLIKNNLTVGTSKVVLY